MRKPLSITLNVVRGLLVLPLAGLIVEAADKIDRERTMLEGGVYAVFAVGVVVLSIALSPALWATPAVAADRSPTMGAAPVPPPQHPVPGQQQAPHAPTPQPPPQGQVYGGQTPFGQFPPPQQQGQPPQQAQQQPQQPQQVSAPPPQQHTQSWPQQPQPPQQPDPDR